MGTIVKGIGATEKVSKGSKIDDRFVCPNGGSIEDKPHKDFIYNEDNDDGIDDADQVTGPYANLVYKFKHLHAGSSYAFNRIPPQSPFDDKGGEGG